MSLKWDALLVQVPDVQAMVPDDQAAAAVHHAVSQHPSVEPAGEQLRPVQQRQLQPDRRQPQKLQSQYQTQSGKGSGDNGSAASSRGVNGSDTDSSDGASIKHISRSQAGPQPAAHASPSVPAPA